MDSTTDLYVDMVYKYLYYIGYVYMKSIRTQRCWMQLKIKDMMPSYVSDGLRQ